MRATDAHQDKIVHLLDAENVDTGNMGAIERDFRNKNKSEYERKFGKLALAACFTSTVSQRDTLFELVWVCYWQGAHVGLTALHGTTEMEYRQGMATLMASCVGISNHCWLANLAHSICPWSVNTLVKHERLIRLTSMAHEFLVDQGFSKCVPRAPPRASIFTRLHAMIALSRDFSTTSRKAT